MRFSNPNKRPLVRLRVERLEPRSMLSGNPTHLSVFDADTESTHAEPDAKSTFAGVPSAWSLTGAGQTVAIIDSGIAYDHPALGGGYGALYRVVGGWDFAEQDADPYDDGPLGFHGTHVAGVLGSSDPQFPGVAPEVDLVALRVFDDRGHSDFAWIEQALWWVHEHRHDYEHPITTINLSLGGLWNDDDVPDWARLESVFAVLQQDGIVTVASAGNDYQPEAPTIGLSYPAASPHVIPVASTDAAGQLSTFTQRHPRVLAAPGEDIMSTVPDYLFGFDGVTDDFMALSGTSVAAPFVAGASVLVREALLRVRPHAVVNQDTIAQVLEDSADSILDPGTGQTFRRLNLTAALQSVLGTPNLPKQTPVAEHTISFGDAVQHTIPLPANQTTDLVWTSRRSGWYQVQIAGAAQDEPPRPTVWRGETMFDGEELVDVDAHTLVFHAAGGDTIRLRLPAGARVGSVVITRVAEFDRGLLTLRGDLAAHPLGLMFGTNSTPVVSLRRSHVFNLRPWLGPYAEPVLETVATDGQIAIRVSVAGGLVRPAPRPAPVPIAMTDLADAAFAATDRVSVTNRWRSRVVDCVMRRDHPA